MTSQTPPAAQARESGETGTLVPDQPDAEEIRIESVLHALADPVRLRIVRQLAMAEAAHVRVELACRDLDVGVSKSTLTHHLRTLREAGVISGRYQGTTRFHTIRREELDKLFPGLLNGVLAARQ